MVRRVRPEQVADRVAVLAAHPCRECARLALLSPLGTAGWLVWLRNRQAAMGDVKPNVPCVDHTGKKFLGRMTPQSPEESLAPREMQEPEYVRYLQEALARERTRANRLKSTLQGMQRTIAAAIGDTNRSAEQTDDLARALAGRRIIRTPPKNRVEEGGQPLGSILQ